METVDDHVHNLLAVPETIGGKLWFLFTLPLRICFKFTLIDVRCVNPKLTNLVGVRISGSFLCRRGGLLIRQADQVVATGMPT